MFDLFRSSRKTVRYLLGGLLTLIALSMVITLIPGFGSSVGQIRDQQVIAEIGKDKLTYQEVQQALNNMMRNQRMPQEMAQIYVPQLIDQMIAERAIAYEARRMGFEVTDAELAASIQQLLPQLADAGPDAYKMFIEQQGMSVPEFEARLRLSTLRNRLQTIAMQGVVITPQEVEQEYRLRNDKVKLAYVAFDVNVIRQKLEPSQAELQNYYRTHAGMFSIPETKNYALVVVDQDKIEQQMQIPDDQLRAYYNTNRDKFQTPERVKVRHILLKTTGKSPDETAKLQKKAQDLLAQLKKGADFADLAKKNSDDPGSGQKGGDLGWIARGQTVPNFEKAAFSLKPGQLSDVITTEYGFHILQVQEHEQARLRPFDEVKNDIATEMKKAGVNDRVQQVADEVRTELTKNPNSLDTLASKFPVQVVRVEHFRPGDPIPALGIQKFDDSATGITKKGEISNVFQLSNSKLAVAVLTDVIPPHAAQFAEVEKAVSDQYKAEMARKTAEAKAKEVADKARANGGDLAAAAKAVGAEVKTSDSFARTGAAEGIGDAAYLQESFTQPLGTLIGPINTGDTYVVAKSIEKTPADMSKLADSRTKIVSELKERKGQERGRLFQDSVLSQLVREGKVKINREAISRLVQSYHA